MIHNQPHAKYARMTAVLSFSTFLTRGQAEREIEVDVSYTFDGADFTILTARDLTEGRELSDWEWEAIEGQTAEVCDAAYAEWMADYGEYLRDADSDRRAA